MTVVAMLIACLTLVCLSADNFFRTSGRADYFGCEEYREIIWNAYPDPNPAAADDLARDLGHNHIAHMSAPALAFVEIKVPVNPLHMLCLLTGNFRMHTLHVCSPAGGRTPYNAMSLLCEILVGEQLY